MTAAYTVVFSVDYFSAAFMENFGEDIRTAANDAIGDPQSIHGTTFLEMLDDDQVELPADENRRVIRRVVGPDQVIELFGAEGLTQILSKDGERSITIDAQDLTLACLCVKELIKANEHLQTYGDVRSLAADAYACKQSNLFRRDNYRNVDRQGAVYRLRMKATRRPDLLMRLVELAPDGSEEQLALDLFFMTLDPKDR